MVLGKLIGKMMQLKLLLAMNVVNNEEDIMIKEKLILKAGWNLDNSYACLPPIFFSGQQPTPVRSPKLVLLNTSLAACMGLEVQALESEEGVAVLSGNQVPTGSSPLAQAYAGHQFGYFTMLGDGRALLLGEQITPGGDRLDVQLKGSGKTPYSRRGDGRAALGPMLREYIISEAMHALNIPTTKSLAVVTTGERVFREREKTGAILTRIAASHLRVGTFEYASKYGTVKDLQALADYAIKRHFPEAGMTENPYLFLLKEVIKGQAALVAKWQLVGFIHGVMNTDNMTISGETIDYGPCAFMDVYDPETVFSSIDTHGRYAYENQPPIAQWNLARLAEALLPLLHDNLKKAVEIAQEAIAGYTEQYYRNWLSGMRAKLGLFQEEEEDEMLVDLLLSLMREHRADYTNTFRLLTMDREEECKLLETPEFVQWYTLWQARLGRQKEAKTAVRQLMQQHNPAVIPRNHQVEEALEKAEEEGDYSVIQKLLTILSNPYAYSTEQMEFSQIPETSKPYKTFCGT